MNGGTPTQDFDAALLRSAISFLEPGLPEVADCLSRLGPPWVAAGGEDKHDAAHRLLFDTVDVLLDSIEARHGSSLWNTHRKGFMETSREVWRDNERLVNEVLVHMAGKFYRDHLHHVIRVSLLAVYLITCTPELARAVRVDILLLACLTHDIEIPGQKHPNMSTYFQELAHKSCGRKPEIVTSGADTDAVADLGYASFPVLPKANQRAIDEQNHAVYGALKLIRMLEAPNKLRIRDAGDKNFVTAHLFRGIRAVLLHDSYVQEADVESVDAESGVYAGLLMICDEAQEWDRRRGPDDISDIAFLEGVVAADGSWLFNYDYSNATSTPCLAGALGKMKNLSRRSFDTPFPRTTFTFHLPQPRLKMTYSEFTTNVCEIVHRLRWSGDLLLDTAKRLDKFGLADQLGECYRRVSLTESTHEGYSVLIWQSEYRDKSYQEMLFADNPPSNLSIVLGDGACSFISNDRRVQMSSAKNTPIGSTLLNEIPDWSREFICSRAGSMPASWADFFVKAKELLDYLGCASPEKPAFIMACFACQERNDWFALQARS